MSQRYPSESKVAEVFVFRGGNMGYTYECRDKAGQITYRSPAVFRYRREIRDQAKRRWPRAKLVFGA